MYGGTFEDAFANFTNNSLWFSRGFSYISTLNPTGIDCTNVNFRLPVIRSIITARCPNRIRSKFGLLFIWMWLKFCVLMISLMSGLFSINNVLKWFVNVGYFHWYQYKWPYNSVLYYKMVVSLHLCFFKQVYWVRETKMKNVFNK